MTTDDKAEAGKTVTESSGRKTATPTTSGAAAEHHVIDISARPTPPATSQPPAEINEVQKALSDQLLDQLSSPRLTDRIVDALLRKLSGPEGLDLLRPIHRHLATLDKEAEDADDASSVRSSRHDNPCDDNPRSFTRHPAGPAYDIPPPPPAGFYAPFAPAPLMFGIYGQPYYASHPFHFSQPVHPAHHSFSGHPAHGSYPSKRHKMTRPGPSKKRLRPATVGNQKQPPSHDDIGKNAESAGQMDEAEKDTGGIEAELVIEDAGPGDWKGDKSDSSYVDEDGSDGEDHMMAGFVPFGPRRSERLRGPSTGDDEISILGFESNPPRRSKRKRVRNHTAPQPQPPL